MCWAELGYFGNFFFLIETLDFWQKVLSLSLSFLTPSDLLNTYGIFKFVGPREEMDGKYFQSTVVPFAFFLTVLER